MRKSRMLPMAIVTGCGVVLGLTACAPAADHSMRLPSGVSMCVPAGTERSLGFGISLANTSSEAITVTKATASGANLASGRSWVIPRTASADLIGAYEPPYTTAVGWSKRKTLPVSVPARTDYQLVVTMTFPSGDANAEFEGASVTYRTADGASHQAIAHVSAKFKPKC